MKTFLLFLTLLAFGFSATITVNSNATGLDATDSNCTLQEAVLIANNNNTIVGGSNYDECNPSGAYGNDTIVFASSLSGQTITLTSPLSINFGGGSLTIDGGSNTITISGGGSVRIFSLSGSGTLELKNLNLISSHFAGDGSLISLSSGQTLKMSVCFVCYSSATDNGTIHNNGGTVEVVNCTLSGNSTANGSVVFNQSGIVRLSFITAYNNIGVPLAGAGGTINIKNSIIAQASGNICGSGPTYAGVDVFVTSNTNCTLYTSKTLAELKFGTLDFHGGNTRVYSIGPDSAVVNAVTDCTDTLGNPVSKDQRGKDRNKNGQKCDAGAFEVLLTVNASASPPGSGSVSGGGEYEKGATAILTATPNTGYTFSNWLGDCSSCTTSTCNLTVDNNKTCTANFNTTSGGGGGGGDGGNIPTAPPNTSTISTSNGNLLLQTDAGIAGVQTETPSFNIPSGYVATYGAIRMTLNTTTGFATIRLIFPRPIPPGSKVYKVVGSNIYDITAQVSIQGSTITYIVYDNSWMDS
ncbi:MAG: choice-of-anchor Q domain-containing protein [Aquificaceae bacterium]